MGCDGFELQCTMPSPACPDQDLWAPLYVQQIGQPGCMAFLGFSKAYDRLSRPWVLDHISKKVHVQHGLCKWVSNMLQSTSATPAFNVWQSASFPERSGVQQVGMLLPLLYVARASAAR